MRAKKLLFCLLFLTLGTTAWADEYYTVGSRVAAGNLEIGTGKLYMIYNTTFDGNQDRSGFLYNAGTTFGLTKFRSVDKYICNGAFVFTIEDAPDDDPHTIYLKSLPSNGYLDVDGRQHIDPVTLNLYTWDEAISGDDYTASTNGVTLTDKNSIKQACVKSLNDKYTVVAEDQITSASNAVYVIANKENTWYFNGNTDSYAAYTQGHPFAFYEVNEVTRCETFNIQDLHIFSRADLFSAHKIYGFVKDATKQITTSCINLNGEWDAAKEGPVENLTDGDFKTYHITDWGYNDSNNPHYYQIDLGTSVQELRFYMACRADRKHAPKEYEVWASNAADGGFVKVYTGTTPLDAQLAYLSGIIDLGASYRYIRIQAPVRTASEACLAFAELYVLPNNEVINSSLPYLDNTLPVAGTELTYKTRIERYNNEAALTKLLSGVPIPGNKYRIYADAYDIDAGEYVNRDLSTDGTKLIAYNAYNAADDKTAFEWFCEETADGLLHFRNVKYPTLYLATAGVTDNADLAKWTIHTEYTQRHGVPLRNTSMQYLTVYNGGHSWMGDIKEAQNQREPYFDDKNTPDNTADDVTVAEGLCTDFVFLPVELEGNEKQLTIRGTSLVQRNATVAVDGVNYKIPFSRVFTNGVGTITVTANAAGFHDFVGFFKGETNVGTTITDALFEDGTLESGDVLEARFEVKGLPQKSTDGNIKLYRIKNQRGISLVAQKAGASRAGIDYDDDEYISMATLTYYYASFVSKNEDMALVYNEKEFTARSLFYFTNKNDSPDESFQVFINSAVTTFRSNKANEWTDGGSIYYIQPNAVGDGLKGFSITSTQLDAENEPSNAWCSNHTGTDKVLDYWVEDAGSAWQFVEVEDDEATTELVEYIKEEAARMIKKLIADKEIPELSESKIDNTIAYIESIAGRYDTENDSFDNTGAITSANVTALVGYSQQLHMLHHEIEYAMQALPQPTAESDDKSAPIEPKWYYVKNVFGSSYAKYDGAESLMKLTTGNKTLGNLYYFAGEVENADTKDEYLKAHIHNFMALNMRDVTQDSTLVSQNQALFSKEITPVGGGTQTQIDISENPLQEKIAWELTLEYNLASGAFFNGWGSGLLASGSDAAIDKGDYRMGFQVYLQSSGHIVVRAGDSGAGDGYKFTHTEGAYSNLKIVLSYANKRLQVAVTNSEGVTATIKDTPTGLQKDRDYIPCPFMTDITQFASAMSSASSFKVDGDVVLAMKWNTHANNLAAGQDGDVWYILPSSNANYRGLAIVTDGADDKNMGWSNVDGVNKDIFTALGSTDYSTWQFEKVTDFTSHIEELLNMYKISDCAIYNKELAELCKRLEEIASGEPNEETFNLLLNTARGYTGPMPYELQAPRPGSFYTIHHISDDKVNDFKVNEHNKVNISADANVGEDFDSRGVWYFESTHFNGGLFALDSELRLKNLHTQSFLNASGLTAEELALNPAESSTITINKEGGAVVTLQLGSNYLASTTDGKIHANDTKLDAGDTSGECDRWYIEEITDRSKVMYSTIVEEGYSTLMLGFTALIPEEVEAYNGSEDGIIHNKKYLSMQQYDNNVLAANTPVVLKSVEEGKAVEAKFYYSEIAGIPEDPRAEDDRYLRGALWQTVVSSADIETELGVPSINIYMLQSGKTGPKMYWIYEEYEADGTIKDGNANTDNGGHVVCKANKAYIVIPSEEASNRSSFSFYFGGDTTGIEGVDGDCDEDGLREVYDLQGRKVNNAIAPGIYIINGKKAVVK